MPWEIVHHKNGDKNNNNIENLELMSAQSHDGIAAIMRYVKKLEKKI